MIIVPIVINEVATKGSTGTCNDEDWVELWNPGNLLVNLEDFILHDDKGSNKKDAYKFGPTHSIGPSEYLLLCGKSSFKFGIGSSDTVSLTNNIGHLVATTGELSGEDSIKDITYARMDGGDYVRTEIPTPGAENQFRGNIISYYNSPNHKTLVRFKTEM